MINNEVHDNVNKIPFYAEYMDDQDFMDDHQMEEARPGYGSANSSYIIDGPGISLTRNSQFYKHGRTEVSFNSCYRNGINGIAVHKTFRVRVIGNKIWDNGQVPKAPAPEDRQPYAGLTLNQSEDVIIMDNQISITDPTDFGYVLVGNASYDKFVSRDNTLCNGKLSKNDWTGTVTVLPEGCPLYLDEDQISITTDSKDDEAVSPSVNYPYINKFLNFFANLF